MAKKILLARNTPHYIPVKSYNIQEMGIGKAFCRLGYDYDHVCFNPREDKEWVFYEAPNGCKARFIERKRFRIFRWGINFDLVKKSFLNQYDYIITREYYQPMTILYAKNGKNVSMYNGPYWNMFFLKITSPIYDFLFTKFLNKHLKGKFVKSGMSKEFLEAKGYTDITNVGVALDIEKFETEEPIKEDTQKVVDYMTSNKCILYIGHLDSNKNLPFMLNVYKELLKSAPDLKFVMIGKSVMSGYKKLFGKKDEDYAKEQFARLDANVRAGILHVRRIDNTQLRYIYPLAKAFLLPSKFEIFGMVMLEAMYFGAPVVTSRNGGSTTLIEGRNTGIMIPRFDVAEWSFQIMSLINDSHKRAEIIESAHNLVVSEYTWDAIAKKMISKMADINL